MRAQKYLGGDSSFCVVDSTSNSPWQERKINNSCIFQNEFMYLKEVVAFQKARLCGQPVL